MHLSYSVYPEIQTKNNVWRIKKTVGEILRKLCEMKGVLSLEGSISKDHVHMFVSIPPKHAISDVLGYYGRNFRARGYYIATVGNVNEETIRNYIKEQEENDKYENR